MCSDEFGDKFGDMSSDSYNKTQGPEPAILTQPPDQKSTHGTDDPPDMDIYATALKPGAQPADIRAAFFEACGEGRMDMFDALLPLVRDDIDMHGIVCRETTLTMAAFTGQTDIVRRLLESGADAGLQNEGGYTPLHLAAENGDAPMVELLLSHHGYNRKRTRLGDATPLELAAQQGRAGVLRVMAAHGVNLNEQNELGMTALHSAVFSRRPDSVFALLQLGADPDIRDSNGRTAEEMSEFTNYRASLPAFAAFRSLRHAGRIKTAARQKRRRSSLLKPH